MILAAAEIGRFQEVSVAYVDGFVLAVPQARLDEYRKLAELAAEVWTEHGALAYTECVADDVPPGELTSFPKAVMAGADEVVVFAWIVYASREERDVVNAKVMADPRLRMPEDRSLLPFDAKRMIYGGFRALVGRARPTPGPH